MVRGPGSCSYPSSSSCKATSAVTGPTLMTSPTGEEVTRPLLKIPSNPDPGGPVTSHHVPCQAPLRSSGLGERPWQLAPLRGGVLPGRAPPDPALLAPPLRGSGPATALHSLSQGSKSSAARGHRLLGPPECPVHAAASYGPS